MRKTMLDQAINGRTAGLAVQVCDSHFCTFPMYSLNLKINTKMKKYGT